MDLVWFFLLFSTSHSRNTGCFYKKLLETKNAPIYNIGKKGGHIIEIRRKTAYWHRKF